MALLLRMVSNGPQNQTVVNRLLFPGVCLHPLGPATWNMELLTTPGIGCTWKGQLSFLSMLPFLNAIFFHAHLSSTTGNSTYSTMLNFSTIYSFIAVFLSVFIWN